ncbi:hypothetical protein GM415_15580 [Pseudodesulfovibrio cashew]|uniref:Uncharacterized protein n=1 Tax=Pseudodesulfovibrio cashew TaxID=2678688 RepID=A0A6I6JMY1_9BACT|nr:hypothetical protein [Pseudodesulfovibrio cashew]QGY41477.1 hypothetical protein GM415_15580 [Pseudodesulfovibrio cashew]
MNDFQLAISEKVTEALFTQLRDNFSVSHSDSGSFGPFSASYSAGIKLQNGKIDFQNNGTVLIKELDIVYDPLKLTFGIDIPKVTVGGFCIIPKPWGGCALRAPKKTFFGGNPDISVPLDLSGIITTEISASCSAKMKHFDDPANAGLTPWKANALGKSDRWQLFLEPGYVDIDLIDIADTAGNLIDSMVDAAVDQLLGFLPGWARSLVKAILGSFSSLIRKLLDIGDDVQEWLSNMLGVSLGLFNFAVQMVLEYFADKYPIFEFDDPYPMLPTAPGPGGSGALVPVLMPVQSPDITVNDKEMVISASLGVI